MVNLLPAIVIGGPPHAGKSVLTYSLTQALRKRRVNHFVIRACPDGEGDWSQEIDQSMVSRIRVKGAWTPGFVQEISAALERRHFPLLVDVGGRPEAWQTPILQCCTHSLLLLHRHDEATARFWRDLVIAQGLLPLAELSSDLEGVSSIDADMPVIRGTLAGLNRRSLAQGPLFDLLVERVISLFTSYSAEELRDMHLATAPARVVDLDTYISVHRPETLRWEPAMLAPFAATLPRHTPLATYGRGTNWLYGMLALQAGEQPLHQFDSRLGWVMPPPLVIGLRTVPEVSLSLREDEQCTVLSVHPINDHLDYEQATNLPFPPVSRERGLILSGKLPLWLVTAIARLYHGQGVPWIACYYPQESGAIVIASRIPAYILGQHIRLVVFDEFP